MKKDSLNTLTITQAAELLSKREVSSVELTDACLDAIAAKDSDIHAYLEVFADAKGQAAAADAARGAGDASALNGIPLAVKDNILIHGRIASAASKMLENYAASYDATVIERLKAQAPVFLGRTNMDEFAMGGTTENSAFGPTKNPRDLSRVPGGSSGGSAAAVAADMCIAALGTDTGGSVREPAAFCGAVGFKPTYGAVSRFGLIAMGSSLDQFGPLTKSVSDAELIFDAVKGFDSKDSTSLQGGEYAARGEVKRIGVPRNMFGGIEKDVMQNFSAAEERLKSLGYEIVTVDLPLLKKALSIYYIVMFAESSTNLSRFDGVRYGLSRQGATLLEDYAKSRGEGFGPEVRRRILLGTYILSAGYYDAYYGRAIAARKALVADFNHAFETVDAILTPTTPSPAPKFGEKADPLAMYLLDIFTVTPNLTGMPSLSVPSGTVAREGVDVPLGIQFITPHGTDSAQLTVGKRYLGELQ
jgi:aspartyl-tRNA(Asn)/glutamyl-tRNA(Gln) amidotransferase subunit A